MKKLLIIQPHSDDALFSASHFIFEGKYDVSILTVENNEKRVKEDTKLYEFLGIPYKHLEVQFEDNSFYGFHKQYKDVTSENSVEYLKEYFGEETLEEIKSEVVSYVKKYFKKNPDAQIALPWGVGHPMHCFIRDCVQNAISQEYLLFYRDFPHSYKKRAKNQVTDQLKDYELFKSVPVGEFHDTKWELARKFYKSQSGLLWFEQSYIGKQLPEEVYILK